MNDFNKLNIIEKRKMAIEDLVDYYCEYRKHEFNQGKELKGIEFRKKLRPIIKTILKTDQILSKERIIIIGDQHNAHIEGPKIFACTHIGGNDIQRSFQVINEPAYLMLGDPGILYKMPIYQALRMNGVIPLETKDREDRKIAYKRSIELLEKDGNLLIYPEGARNVSPNVIVMKMFVGTARMAKEAGVPIIPIAIEQYGNDFYFNIGKDYTISKDCEKSDKELTDELRDKLTTLKWEIMETQPMLKRSEIPDNYLPQFQDEIVERCNYGYGFSLEDALSESFHDKTIAEPEEVFNFLDNIDIDRNNAFLAKDKQWYKTLKKVRK